MPEEVLFESESRQSRAAVATYLRRVAEGLESGDPLTLTAGERSVTVRPSARLTFEVKVEREGPAEGPGELSLELELEWPEDGDDEGPLEIE